MILILSEETDSSTTNIIEWLGFLNKKWIRINEQDILNVEFIGDDILFEGVDIKFKLSEITSFWYRRGRFRINNKYETNIQPFDLFHRKEINKFIEFIYFKLNKLKYINSISNVDVNKLVVNDIARDLGILTPKDLIFSNTKTLKDYFKADKTQYISKEIGGGSMVYFDDFTIFNYSTLLDVEKVKTESFFPSLVQNYIAKKYELRIFYLNDIFYSMAIFSQKDSKTNVDFRNYNNKKPNRTVPFKLPNEIQGKLKKLMYKLNLNSGSIDMIVTPDDKYVFLEVNPVGQFGMTSFPCNFNLEKIIAETL